MTWPTAAIYLEIKKEEGRARWARAEYVVESVARMLGCWNGAGESAPRSLAECVAEHGEEVGRWVWEETLKSQRDGGT
ncbi:MAG TPA: hypothetical protein PLK80_08040 [bacterium]|nr:hypothetical protein [bacterium]HPI76673.1 hypothetical protein [bacterium]